jgi:hypothetical protein
MRIRFAHWCVIAMIVAMFAVASEGRASIITQAFWRLGEAGTVGTNNRPQDSSGNGRHILNTNSTNMLISTSVDPRAGFHGSTQSYLDGSAPGGYWLTSYDPPEDNVGLEMFVKMDNPASNLTTDRVIMSLGGSTGMTLFASTLASPANTVGLAAGLAGTSSSALVGSPYVPAAGEWVHLALVRDNGVSTFYVNGLPFGATSASVPNNNTGVHFGVNPGGTNGFVGCIDEMRLFTFAPGQFQTSDLLSTVPEPSSWLLLGLGTVGLFGLKRSRDRFRRVRQKR